MKNLVSKIWVPFLIVTMAALQSFGIDAGRATGLRRHADSLLMQVPGDSMATTVAADSLAADSLAVDSLIVDSLIVDSLAVDSLTVDSLTVDSLTIAAKDTIRIPDSLQFTDPFFFKYYIAVKDSTTRREVRDSLIQAGDTLELMKLDSLYIKDSTEVATAKFNAWYSSLSRRERKKYDAEQALPALIAAANRKMEIKDSIRAYKDSVIQATPRILETFAIPDSLHYKGS